MLGISPREKQVLLYSVRLCYIYWRYTGDQCWRNGGRTRFPTVWPVFESEMVEFIGSALDSAPKGFCLVLTFALKTKISCFQLIWSVP